MLAVLGPPSGCGPSCRTIVYETGRSGCAAAIVGDTGTVGPVSAPLCRSWWGHFELTRPPGRYSAIWRALCSPSMIAECRHGTLHRVSLEVGAEDFS